MGRSNEESWCFGGGMGERRDYEERVAVSSYSGVGDCSHYSEVQSYSR